jgi:hypothetical protein
VFLLGKQRRIFLLRRVGRICIFAAEGFPMNVRKIALGSALSLAMFAAGFTAAQERHPNLRAAQDLINQAFDRITAAQQANEWDMGGHAAKAKDLLVQAKEQIRLAAEAANRH